MILNTMSHVFQYVLYTECLTECIKNSVITDRFLLDLIRIRDLNHGGQKDAFSLFCLLSYLNAWELVTAPTSHPQLNLINIT